MSSFKDLLTLDKVLENEKSAIIISNAKHQIIRVNQKYCNITGYSKDEILGQNPKLVSSGKHNKLFYKKMWETLNSKGEWKGKLTNKGKDGNLFYIFADISIIRSSNGEISHYIERSYLLD